MMRVLGLDPGLRNTGWGVIEAEANRLRHVANGVVTSDPSGNLAERLLQLAEGIEEVLRSYEPSDAAVETSLSNKNPASTLKLAFQLPGSEVRHEIEGRVTWAQRSDPAAASRTPGMGIEFSDRVASARLARELQRLAD